MTAVHHRYATVAGRKLFYREAGPADAPAIVLLHGFPTSSFVAAPGAAPEPPMDRALRQVDSIDALRAWAEAYVDQLERNDFRDGCVLSALAGPLAAANPAARADVGTGLTRWVTELAGSLRAIRDRGELCPEADPDTLASSLLATLLGGTLLAKTMRDIAPLRSAIAAVMASVQSPATVQEAE
jgi:pimeloyl-ACP methyl ester carboxylesterase